MTEGIVRLLSILIIVVLDITTDGFSTHQVVMYTTRNSDLIFVCLHCICNSPALPWNIIFALGPFLTEAYVLSLQK